MSGPLIVEFATYAQAPGRVVTGPATVAPFSEVPELMVSGPGTLPVTVEGLFTVTVKLPETVPGVSSASVAEQVTVVVAMGNVEPEGWSQLGVGAVTSSGSEAVAV